MFEFSVSSFTHTERFPSIIPYYVPSFSISNDQFIWSNRINYSSLSLSVPLILIQDIGILA